VLLVCVGASSFGLSSPNIHRAEVGLIEDRRDIFSVSPPFLVVKGVINIVNKKKAFKKKSEIESGEGWVKERASLFFLLYTVLLVRNTEHAQHTANVVLLCKLRHN
jgi:hypothetical protein